MQRKLLLAVLALLFLFPMAFAKAPAYSIDTLSVFQSSSTTIGAGTSVCTSVDVSGVTASCDTNLSRSTSYRFELVISNAGDEYGDANHFDFQDVYAASGVIGSDATLSACGCLDDAAYKSGAPLFSGNDVVCTLPSGDPCRIEKNGGSEAFYFVLTTGSDSASGSGSFFISETGVDSNTSASVSFSYCNIACSSDAACDDSNSLTTDTCSSPGTCSASCSNVACSVACSSDAACDDSNSLTTDTCNSPGTCSASCSNTVSCTPACSSDSGCNDSNSLTVDTCSNPGTCSASCSNVLCSFACTSNADCDDSNSLTSDTCSSPSTCSASCSHSSCTPFCFINADCDDSDPMTVDTCNNAGQCDANCSSVVCTPSCYEDADCDDSDSETQDTCIHPGKCGAHCDNFLCTPACSSDSDCADEDPKTADKCLNPGSCTASCSNEACTVACEDNSECDDSDISTMDACGNPGTCEAECSHKPRKDFSFKFVSDLNSVGRGRVLDLNLLVSDLDGNPVEDANISLTGPDGEKIYFDSSGNGYYSGSYSVPPDSQIGQRTLSFMASSGNSIGVEQLTLNIGPGNIRAVLVKPPELRAVLGEKLEIMFRLVYDDNTSVGAPDANAALNGVDIPLSMDSNFIFTGYYLFSESELEGATLVVTAFDSLGNRGSTTIEFVVQRPLSLEMIAVASALVIAVLIAIYGIRKTRRLSLLLRRLGGLKISRGTAGIQKSITKEKNQIDSLERKIARQEKDMNLVKKEIALERKMQAISFSSIPSESKHAVHKSALGAFLFPGKVARLLRGIRKSKDELKVEKRIQAIDAELDELREKIQNLESEFCKQTIKEDFFRKKLFEYREQVHLLELEKKKIE